MKTNTVVSRKLLYILCLFVIFPGIVSAQKLTLQGDTIYVSDLVPVTIEFPASIYGDPQLVDPTAPYKIVKKLNSVFITAAAKDVKPVSAIISEGKRDHSIVLCYKKGLKRDVDDYYDLATPKKLEDFVNKSKERRRIQALVSNTTSTNAMPSSTTNAVSNAQKEEDKSHVNALIKDGDAAVKSEDLDKAENIFTEVVKIDNGNAYAKKKSRGYCWKKSPEKKAGH